jgi:hypothetical protein
MDNNNNAQKIIRHEWIEIPVPANSTLTRFQFPDLPNLRNVLLFGLETYTSVDISKSINNQLDLINSNALLPNCYVTLVNYGGKEFLKQMPIRNLMYTFNVTGDNTYETYPKYFCGQRVNWPKSYIQSTQAVSQAFDTTFVLSCYYSMPPAIENAEDNFTFGNKG